MFSLYEDDGVSLDYAGGRYATTPLRYRQSDTDVTLRVEPAAGSFDGQLPRRAYTFELAGFGDIAALKVDGKKARSRVENGMTLVDIPARDIRRGVTLTFTTNPTATQ